MLSADEDRPRKRRKTENGLSSKAAEKEKEKAREKEREEERERERQYERGMILENDEERFLVVKMEERRSKEGGEEGMEVDEGEKIIAGGGGRRWKIMVWKGEEARKEVQVKKEKSNSTAQEQEDTTSTSAEDVPQPHIPSSTAPLQGSTTPPSKPESNPNPKEITPIQTDPSAAAQDLQITPTTNTASVTNTQDYLPTTPALPAAESDGTTTVLPSSTIPPAIEQTTTISQVKGAVESSKTSSELHSMEISPTPEGPASRAGGVGAEMKIDEVVKAIEKAGVIGIGGEEEEGKSGVAVEERAKEGVAVNGAVTPSEIPLTSNLEALSEQTKDFSPAPPTTDSESTPTNKRAPSSFPSSSSDDSSLLIATDLDEGSIAFTPSGLLISTSKIVPNAPAGSERAFEGGLRGWFLDVRRWRWRGE